MPSFDDVTAAHVHLTMAEYDELGADAFLDRYGYGPFGGDALVHEDRSYDATAILGAAVKHVTGASATPDELSDGPDAAEVLTNLGFEVAGPAEDAEDDAEADQWQEASEVGVEASRAAWAEAAREELIEVAGRYHAVMTSKELAAAVQERSGIRTSQPPHYWIGDVLQRVARACAAKDEPLLSSLCVNADGSVGEGYAEAVESITGTKPADLDDHAAVQRLECHRRYDAADLPSHGGTKALTPQLSAARSRARKKFHSEKPANLCPTCQMALPATGICDNCD
jgi:hypothetical protein